MTVSRKLGVGIVGCGNISSIYFQNAALFNNLELRACASLNFESAKARSEQFGVKALLLDEFWREPGIDVVVNLTVPAAHKSVTEQALETGHHVYSEKPLALTVADAQSLIETARRCNKRLGVASDTFLGPGHALARDWVDSGELGPIKLGTASMMTHGMEHWHPNPRFFYERGVGPLMDIGPYYITELVFLLGAVRSVQAMRSRAFDEREVSAAGALQGQKIPVEVDTSDMALLHMANGAIISLVLSWDVWAHAHRPMELHGTLGTLRPPDPNVFGGVVEHAIGRGAWQSQDTRDRPCGMPNRPEPPPYKNANYRMLGVAEMIQAIHDNRPHRASAELGLHVLQVLEAIATSAASGQRMDVPQCAQPAALSDPQRSSLLKGMT
jgi:predicted dehydrogenase